MPKFYGTTGDKIDWKTVIDLIKDETASVDITDPGNLSEDATQEENEKIALDIIEKQKNTYFKCVEESSIYLRKETDKTFKAWRGAGYKVSEITWEDFYAEDFPILTVASMAFSKIVGLRPIPKRVFVTRLVPGKIAPWHYDTIPDVTAYRKFGTMERYVCFIQEPIPGHTLSFENVTYYNEKVGNIYKWDTVDEYHSAANSSLLPYYLFHFQGY